MNTNPQPLPDWTPHHDVPAHLPGKHPYSPVSLTATGRVMLSRENYVDWYGQIVRLTNHHVIVVPDGCSGADEDNELAFHRNTGKAINNGPYYLTEFYS